MPVCGIAGYCVTPEFLEKFGTPERQEAVLKDAWYFNIHRGKDSAGFFAFDSNGEFTTYKSPGQADTIFKADFEGKNILAPSLILGAHTRAPSAGSGDPSDNENNHPVSWGNCYAIHNGCITNDIKIKKSFALAEKGTIPEVDSVAIPMVFENVDIGSSIEIIEALEMLRGGFATNIVWADKPGFSLIARGDTNPLIVALHPSGAMFYASEKDAVWHMIDSFGVKNGTASDDGNWTYKTMDRGTYMLFENGLPIDWDSFKVNVNTYASKLDHYMVRFLPPAGKRKRKEIYRTDSEYDYVGKAQSPSMLDEWVEEDVVYSVNKGFADKTAKFDSFKGENAIENIVAEADLVVDNGDELYSIFVQDVEIVVNASRVVKDIFDHSKFTNRQRWVREEKTPTPAERAVPNNYTLNEFFYLNKKTGGVTGLPVKRVDYPFAKSGGSGKATASPNIYQLPLPRTTKNGKNTLTTSQSGEDIFDGDELNNRITPRVNLGWNTDVQHDIYGIDVCAVHDDEPTLIFTNKSGHCGVHNVDFTKHPDPFECGVVLRASSYCLAGFTDVSLYYALGEGMDVDWSIANLDNKPCKADQHFYDITKYIRVFNNAKFWEVPLAQECVFCHQGVEVKTPPDWLARLTTSPIMKRKAIAVDYVD